MDKDEGDYFVEQNVHNVYENYDGGSPFDPNDDREPDKEKNENFGEIMFCTSKYIKCLLRMLYVMRSHHMLTDVILEVGSEIFHAHKVILAAASPYFKVK